jgi:hypothetical protein
LEQRWQAFVRTRLTTKSIPSLIGTSKAADLETPFRNMLSSAADCPFPPQAKRRGAQLGPHQMNHFSRRETKLTLDGIKAGSVFPSHLDNPISIGE